MNENPTPAELTYKRCPQCAGGQGMLKRLSEFPKNKARADGLGSCCKVCHAENQKAVRQVVKKKVALYDQTMARIAAKRAQETAR